MAAPGQRTVHPGTHAHRYSREGSSVANRAGRKPDRVELGDIQVYWSMIVRRLHVRIYHNPEFALTLTEETSPRPTSHIPFLSIGLKTSKTLSGQPKPGKMRISSDLCDSFHAPAALKGELCPNADTSERLRRMSGHGFVHSSKILLKSSTS